MTNKWDKRWFELLDWVSSQSKDPSTKVGAVAIPKDSDIPIIGWNGFPRKVKDWKTRYEVRELKYKFVVHAELNCIFNATRHGISLMDGSIYITHPPCNICAGGIIQCGIKKVVYKNREFTDPLKWKESFEYSKTMFEEAEIELIEHFD